MVWILVSTSERITRLYRDSLYYVELVSTRLIVKDNE
nr:MAG TPA: hypothetical protein [Caudoviricetes sp.]